MHADGLNPDEDLRREACQIMRFQNYNNKKNLQESQIANNVTFDAANTQDPAIDSKLPEWMRELHAVLVVYWETGEVSDDIEDDWFDEMIARITPLAL